MKQVIMLLLFIGVIMIMHGIYQQKLKAAKENVKIEYRFIPRTYYEEQLSSNTTVTGNFKNMFDKTSPWMEGQFSENVTKP